MVLSDIDIIERLSNESIVIEPYTEDNVEPASVDLRLGHDFEKVFKPNIPEKRVRAVLSDEEESHIGYEECEPPVIIEPGQLILGTTLERVEMPDDLAAQVLGRSSLGRLGVSVHQTAGYIDPGFEGQITLELANHGPVPVELEPELRICQIVFKELSSHAVSPYGHDDSQYQDQSGATRSGMIFD